MTRKQEISKLIEICKLLTDRCKKIEVDSMRHIKELKQRIEELEEKTYLQ